ncbi:hypothetical protein BWQ96_08328 [Gracilariopsis chorda]|uniref:Uncharacterized protein n=1 Tax=Gracilariopsis chorda TaxID=448386 RepID=A0A2V3IIS3_9FLOR|nr:hypothetical protein BWQ96_08328 [Gracilariopsis chorda]|eukprot:PXF41948.1 hypothetical protein BWQ96_08328 [Gracilariopsis chorda]
MSKRTLSRIAAVFVVIAMATLVTLHATRKDINREYRNRVSSVVPDTALSGNGWEWLRRVASNVAHSDFHSRAELTPLVVDTESAEGCVVFLATMCTLIPFAGCEECKQMIADMGVAPRNAEYVFTDVCRFVSESSICAHFESLGACHTCKLRYPDGPPPRTSLK